MKELPKGLAEAKAGTQETPSIQTPAWRRAPGAGFPYGERQPAKSAYRSVAPPGPRKSANGSSSFNACSRRTKRR
jgi:hypothetical protein